ncbi:hypothetical protein [Rheinheimera salexigens]|uniref:Uncharacterized protein n=1 Tax=Rheinheimera salexigens TaxID=1628148 RepID=A0A1E7Q6Q7_9GAMM|nr:hypothetical protein [Rheinheimera salexigens]OEY69790.1 hypothetical protein BI198_09600 [Rheinheimera salexigens]
MINVINILEHLASDAAFKYATPEQLQAFLQSEISDNRVIAALQHTNVDELERALQVRTGLICGIMPAEEPEEQPEQEPAEDTEQSPEKSALLQRVTQQPLQLVG